MRAKIKAIVDEYVKKTPTLDYKPTYQQRRLLERILKKHLSQEKWVEIKVKWDEWVKCPSCKTNCIRLHNYCRICWVKLKWIA